MVYMPSKVVKQEEGITKHTKFFGSLTYYSEAHELKRRDYNRPRNGLSSASAGPRHIQAL